VLEACLGDAPACKGRTKGQKKTPRNSRLAAQQLSSPSALPQSHPAHLLTRCAALLEAGVPRKASCVVRSGPGLTTEAEARWCRGCGRLAGRAGCCGFGFGAAWLHNGPLTIIAPCNSSKCLTGFTRAPGPASACNQTRTRRLHDLRFLAPSSPASFFARVAPRLTRLATPHQCINSTRRGLSSALPALDSELAGLGRSCREGVTHAGRQAGRQRHQLTNTCSNTHTLVW